MKTKITLTLAALFAALFVNAQQKEIDNQISSAKGVQFAKGDMFVEGAIRVNTGTNGGQTVKTTSYGINPKFGYLLNDKFAVGADIDFGGSKVKGSDDKTSLFGIGLFARHYFYQADSKRFKAFGELGLGYGRNTVKFSGYSDTNNSFKTNLTVGLNYFFAKNFAATFTLADLISYNNVSADGGSSNDFSLNIGTFNNIFAQSQFGLLYKF